MSVDLVTPRANAHKPRLSLFKLPSAPAPAAPPAASRPKAAPAPAAPAKDKQREERERQVRHWKRIFAGRCMLRQAYPNAFAEFGCPPRPLKIGIFDDITAAHPEWSLGVLRGAMQSYARTILYLEAVVVGAERIDLDGNPVGVVTEAEAETAVKHLAVLRAKQIKGAVS